MLFPCSLLPVPCSLFPCRYVKSLEEHAKEKSHVDLLHAAKQQNRRQVKHLILANAHIVFTTLSSSGLDVLEDLEEADLSGRTHFDTVVVDEAAQCVELECLIPLRFRSSRCVLIGDPKQLPATTFSATAKANGYSRSLFERLEACGHPVHLLNRQYRCHPMISAFPCGYFYDGKVQDADNVQTSEYDRIYHRHPSGVFRPLSLLNMRCGKEGMGKGKSMQVRVESQIIRLHSV